MLTLIGALDYHLSSMKTLAHVGWNYEFPQFLFCLLIAKALKCHRAKYLSLRFSMIVENHAELS